MNAWTWITSQWQHSSSPYTLLTRKQNGIKITNPNLVWTFPKAGEKTDVPRGVGLEHQILKKNLQNMMPTLRWHSLYKQNLTKFIAFIFISIQNKYVGANTCDCYCYNYHTANKFQLPFILKHDHVQEWHVMHPQLKCSNFIITIMLKYNHSYRLFCSTDTADGWLALYL